MWTFPMLFLNYNPDYAQFCAIYLFLRKKVLNKIQEMWWDFLPYEKVSRGGKEEKGEGKGHLTKIKCDE